MIPSNWAIFPVIGKRPHTTFAPHGLYDATTDRDAARLWTGYTGLGLRCGAASGVVVVDIDPRAGGIDSMASMIAEFGPPPRGPICITGRGDGGLHLYYAYQPGLPNGYIADGVDVRGDGKYVVMPPSIHPDTGGRYQWATDDDPMMDLPFMPQWMVDLGAKS